MAAIAEGDRSSEAGAGAPGEGGAVAARLRAFLRGLPVETCIRIMEALDHARLAGESFPGAEMIAGELVAVISAQKRRRQRANNPQRSFFAILEPLLIDEHLPDKQAGRIARASLAPVWSWLARDLAPAEIAAYEEALLDAVIANDGEAARAHTARLHKLIAPLLRAAIAPQRDEVAHRKTISQIGGERVFDDLRDMLVAFDSRDSLKAVADRLAGPVRPLDEAHLSFLLSTILPFSRGGAAAMPHAATIAMARLASPWQIARVAAAAAESHEVARILATPFGAIVEMLVADVERFLIRAETARQAGDGPRLAVATRDFAQAVRALVTDLDMAPDLALARRLALLRSRMAQLLRPELDTLPARVRRVLNARAGGGRGANERFDEDDIAAIEAGLDTLVVVKAHAAELALNEVTLRVFSDLQSFLDGGVNPLLDGLRTMAGEERVFRLRQLDAAVRIAQRVLGASYAALLAKAIDVAAGERRPATKSA